MSIISLVVLLFSIIAHELAHGYMAYHFGDPTAKLRGRLSWNPLVHIDLFGSVVLPLLLMLSGSSVLFGWAKPVPVDPGNMRNPRKDMMWVGAAGPLANITIAVVVSRILVVFPNLGYGVLGQVLVMLVVINIMLPVFNLIPIPPLDGSRILAGLLPYRSARILYVLEPYGIAIVFLLVYFGLFSKLIDLMWPIVNLLLGGV